MCVSVSVLIMYFISCILDLFEAQYDLVYLL